MSIDSKEKMQEYFDKIRQITLLKAFKFKAVLFLRKNNKILFVFSQDIGNLTAKIKKSYRPFIACFLC